MQRTKTDSVGVYLCVCIICVYTCVYICAIHAYVYIHAYMYVTMITKENEAIHLRVRGHGRGLSEGSWEGLEEEKGGGTDVPLFQLRTCFLKKSLVDRNREPLMG